MSSLRSRNLGGPRDLQTGPCSWALGAVLFCWLLAGLPGCKGGGGNGGSSSTFIDPPAEPEPPGDQPAFPFIEHLDQIVVRDGGVDFDELFIIGDELFEAQFGALDGVGVLELPDGTPLPTRFSRVPPGGGRFTGPNGQACGGCHNVPFPTSAGEIASNVLQDPARSGVGPFNSRNTISLFGSGILQRLAEEMTEALLEIRDTAVATAVPGGAAVTLPLDVDGISFGSITAQRDGGGVVTVDVSAVEGVSPDLVIRPFGWKGDTPSLRGFCRDAARNELGMEADELVAKDALGRDDPDGDGVVGELSVGDITAVAIYVAAQETPTTLGELTAQGLLPPQGSDFEAARARGEVLFAQIGCGVCHVSELHLRDPVFEEPTRRGGGNYFDGDIDAVATGLDLDAPFRFDLGQEGDFPRPQPHSSGGLRIALFGDLKRHNMGTALADAQPTAVNEATGEQLVHDGAPVFVAESVFLTADLWGVGNTGPWLHDGRAATIEDAILLHGVESPPPVGDPGRSAAQEARDAFALLFADDREAVVTFLKSLVLFALPEEE